MSRFQTLQKGPFFKSREGLPGLLCPGFGRVQAAFESSLVSLARAQSLL